MSMTERQFITQIIRLYRKARQPFFPDGTIKRAEGRSISSLSEDLLAKYLADATRHKFLIRINQPLFCAQLSSPNKLKPDLSIIRGNQIVAFVDVKTDLGYKRDEFFYQSRNKDRLIIRLRGRSISGKQLKRDKKTELNLSISKHIKYHIVLISSKNISKERFRVIKSKFEKLKASTLYIFTENNHPNQPELSFRQTCSAVRLRRRDFTTLVKNINQAK